MSHYSDPIPAAASSPRIIPLVLPDLTVDLQTDRGVFSGDRVDPGTKLLLQESPSPPKDGALLDVGCGYGPIAITLAHRSPAAMVWAIDVNERARDLTILNARRSDLTNVTVCAPEDVPDTLSFDALYSNPPIRIGKAALYALLDMWLPRTNVAYLVIHKHLGSDSVVKWMTDTHGWEVQRLVSRVGYRILEVHPT